MTSRSNNDKFCTVLTDASWCPQEKVAGWAAWIVCNDARFKHYAAFRERVISARDAEIQAIINGCYLAKRIFTPDHYHVVSDCVDAMRALQGIGATREWQEKLISIVGTTKVTFKHVKAHTNTQDKRSYVNNWCDFNAKMAMRSLRTIVKEN